LNTNMGRHKILHPLPKDDGISVVENAPRMFLKFLSTNEHNQCKIHLSSSSLRMVSNRSIPISLLSQVEPVVLS
jgi:hypothetical protein